MKTEPPTPPQRNDFGPVVLPHCLSLQADRFSRWILEQLTSRFLDEMRSKASLGTEVMPVLSQMILDRDARDRAALCRALKTPGFSYHSLVISKEGGRWSAGEMASSPGFSSKILI